MIKEIIFAEKNKLDETEHVTSDIHDILSKHAPYSETSNVANPGVDPSIYLDSTVVRFGVAIDKTNSNPDTRVSYIQDAVGMVPAHMDFTTGKFNYGTWENVWFIRKNKPVMLKYNGTEAYELNPNDYSKKLDGTPSDVSDSTFLGNAMSRIPLVYLSMTEDTKYEYISVSNVKYDETYVPIAHTREDGTVMDTLYISMFKAYKNGSKLKSTLGMYPANSLNADKEMAMAKANGEGWNTRTWGQRMLINALLMIISKSDNSQAKFGGGVSDVYNPTDRYKGMIPSGSLSDRGQFFGSQGLASEVKVFHIEGWWGNQWERIAGLVSDHGKIKYTFTGPYNLTGKDYIDSGIVYTDDLDEVTYPSKSSTSKAGRFPIEFTGSSNTYTCDGFWLDKNELTYVLVGGLYGDAYMNGMHYINFNAKPSLSNLDIGVGISYL